MSGPDNRPIRDDRHLRYAASDDPAQYSRKHHKGREPDGAPPDFAEDVAKGTPVGVAAFRRFATHCGTCGVIFLLSLAWMLGLATPFGLASPFARADELERIKASALKTTDVVDELYARQLSADIRSYQESLCRVESLFLRGELERTQNAYEKQTGRRYPMLPCAKQRE